MQKMLWGAAAALSLSAPAAHAITYSQCHLSQFASIDFRMDRGRVIVPVTAELHRAWMVLSTQSAITVMWADRAPGYATYLEDLHKKITIGNQHLSQAAVAISFQIGSAAFSKSQFLLVPAPMEDAQEIDGAPVIGALGIDFFARTDFELDFANQKLNLYTQDHCPGEVVYWANSWEALPMRRGKLGNYYFPVVLEGKKIAATVATANRSSSLTTDVTRRLYGFDDHSAGIDHETDPAGRTVSHYRAMALSAEGLKVSDEKVLLEEPPTGCTLTTWDQATVYSGCDGTEAPLRLGMSVLRHLHLYFATREQVLYVTAADAALSSRK
jgi:hypothetical protein